MVTLPLYIRLHLLVLERVYYELLLVVSVVYCLYYLLIFLLLPRIVLYCSCRLLGLKLQLTIPLAKEI